MSNNNSPKRMGGFRFSIYWMYAIIGIILIGAAFYQDNTVVKDLNKKGGGWPQFVKYVEQGGIKEIRIRHSGQENIQQTGIQGRRFTETAC